MVTKQQILAARTHVDETQQAFGERFGVDQSTIARWEENGPPSKGAAKLALAREIPAIMMLPKKNTEAAQ